MTVECENRTVTPNGNRLAFFQSPWRGYTVLPADHPDTTDHDAFYHPWTPDEPWGRVPSVTAVNGVLDKSGPLVGWATNVTCEGAWRLVYADADNPAVIGTLVTALREDAEKEQKKRDTKPWLVKWLLKRADDIEAHGYTMPGKWRTFQRDLRLAELDHNTVTREAQIRGTAVHRIGEDWVLHGTFPKLSDYPPEWHGYVRAIARFLADHGDGLKVAEQITGSVRHGYAGTCDTVAVATFGGHTVRLDYKTSRGVYARTHFRQLGAYEMAAVEGGDEPTDRQAIVILGRDGEYRVSFADEVEWREGGPGGAFLRVLDVWRDEQPLKAHEDAEYKARKTREKEDR